MKLLTSNFSIIIPAAGKSERMGGTDKIFWEEAGLSVLERTVSVFYSMGFEEIVVAVREDALDRARRLLDRFSPRVKVIAGGASRAQSVKKALAAAAGKYVLIHDGARPYLTRDLVERVARAVREKGSAVPVVAVTDTVKTLDAQGEIAGTVKRETLALAQTPQGFERDKILCALKEAGESVTDEASAYEKRYGSCHAVEGDPANRKITRPCDLWTRRTGIGYDTHALVENRKLMLGGVRIPHTKGLDGHSDADVLLHAVADAILTGAGLRDIGCYFPDTDPAYENLAGEKLIEKVVALARGEGWSVAFAAAVVMAEKPKLSPYAAEISSNVSRLIGAPFSVSFTTCEKLGFIGREEGIASCATATLEKKSV